MSEQLRRNVRAATREADRRRKWDERFLTLAGFIATWSKDPDKQVGAVVVSQDMRAATFGYNGFPRGILDSPQRLDVKDTKNMLSVHAELNAILNSGTSLEGWTMYCTEAPCLPCALAIIQAGIKRVVSRKPKDDSRWLINQEQARRMMREAKVTTEWVDRETLNGLDIRCMAGQGGEIT